jgi:hypothetical protein
MLIFVPWLSVLLAFLLGTFFPFSPFPFALSVFSFRHWFPPRLTWNPTPHPATRL